MNMSLSPTVCLDGDAVRQIREEKKLTQLYVAKVVGVTTDTISRWENNRYPSIKRENALRLAEALECPLEDFLQNGDRTADSEAEAEAEPGRSRKPILYGLLGLLLVALALFWYNWKSLQPPPPVTQILANRVLPPFAAPGSVIPVQVYLDASEQKHGFILREHFPLGWKLVEASPPASSLDNENGTARWIVKPGMGLRQIAYLVKVSPGAELEGLAKFSGEIVSKTSGPSSPAPILGVDQVLVAQYLWADKNADLRIDDGEMLEVSELLDEIDELHIDWNLLEKIWDAESYRWNKKAKVFRPYKAPPAKASP